MYAKKNKTLKVLVAALSVVLVVCLSVAGTLAYLQVKTSEVVNTFAPSNIALKLEETTSDYKMIPGKDIDKDPKVTVTADIDSYVFVKVEESANFDTYMTYAIASGWQLFNPTDGTVADGIDTAALDNYVLFREVTAEAAKDGKEFYVLADNKVTVPNTVTKTDMDKLYTNGAVNTTDQPKLTFTAYAIQQAGFANVAAAWTAAQSQQG